MSMNTALYEGRRTERGVRVSVTEGRQVRPLRPRLDLQNHSPTGLEWGYGGSGPAQLALAILADATGDDAQALQLHQDFKWAVVAKIPQDLGRWTIKSEEVRAWVASPELRGAAAALILRDLPRLVAVGALLLALLLPGLARAALLRGALDEGGRVDVHAAMESPVVPDVAAHTGLRRRIDLVARHGLVDRGERPDAADASRRRRPQVDRVADGLGHDQRDPVEPLGALVVRVGFRLPPVVDGIVDGQAPGLHVLRDDEPAQLGALAVPDSDGEARAVGAGDDARLEPASGGVSAAGRALRSLGPLRSSGAGLSVLGGGVTGEEEQGGGDRPKLGVHGTSQSQKMAGSIPTPAAARKPAQGRADVSVRLSSLAGGILKAGRSVSDSGVACRCEFLQSGPAGDGAGRPFFALAAVRLVRRRRRHTGPPPRRGRRGLVALAVLLLGLQLAPALAAVAPPPARPCVPPPAPRPAPRPAPVTPAPRPGVAGCTEPECEDMEKKRKEREKRAEEENRQITLHLLLKEQREKEAEKRRKEKERKGGDKSGERPPLSELERGRAALASGWDATAYRLCARAAALRDHTRVPALLCQGRAALGLRWPEAAAHLALAALRELREGQDRGEALVLHADAVRAAAGQTPEARRDLIRELERLP